MITQVMLLTAFLLSPVLFFLSALSPLLFESFLPEKWHGSAVYFQLMCLAGLFNPIASINLNVLRVKGYSNIVFYIGVVKKALAIAVFICTLPYGITEVIVGQIAVSIIGYVPNAYYSTKLLNYSIPTQLSDFLPSFVLSGVIASMIFWLQYVLDWRPIYELASLGLIAAMLYLAVASLLNLKPYQFAFHFFNRRFNNLRFIP
ncbi:hypothetical protein A3762_25260 [Oleiphilus sp. HI0125]|uniref:hypothetical protein n=1 Tax=Oleiphilus sp. HI0125 TaxID=1822266 RepID=UPI0007C26012|nr:hypothetical protein [Oleiphilus sp. HI0125]KZZ60976.1 hypothetical protein A3762_25260 [Oleiphilus sp. HI0125]